MRPGGLGAPDEGDTAEIVLRGSLRFNEAGAWEPRMRFTQMPSGLFLQKLQ